MAVLLGLCSLGSNLLLDLLPVVEVIGQGSMHFGESKGRNLGNDLVGR